MTQTELRSHFYLLQNHAYHGHQTLRQFSYMYSHLFPTLVQMGPSLHHQHNYLHCFLQFKLLTLLYWRPQSLCSPSNGILFLGCNSTGNYWVLRIDVNCMPTKKQHICSHIPGKHKKLFSGDFKLYMICKTEVLYLSYILHVPSLCKPATTLFHLEDKRVMTS